ncbi:hypothetical protein AC579_10551 [Pseudocercospora musae]|uniref:Uncharacterized protein n=1 Tax=Pseudocercospora musae TaxID=113226 RepID=A0A139IHI2_9PEZI|nr:hypothetical protein AC579_10551 [Pseudocercospora musae]
MAFGCVTTSINQDDRGDHQAARAPERGSNLRVRQTRVSTSLTWDAQGYGTWTKAEGWKSGVENDDGE